MLVNYIINVFNKNFFFCFVLTLIAILFPTFAQEDIQTQRVQFEPGASSATIEGSIKGYETIDYILNAKEGQYMNVSMATKNGANYFNILEPGETEVAIFVGSSSGNQFEGVTKKSGDYKIRVYLMRSAARRNEVANYRLEIIVTNPENKNENEDALVPGTNYHATGEIPCYMGGGQPKSSCPFGVTREGNGSGMVTITKPDGSKRTIFFENGKATGYDQSQADKGKFSSKKEGGLYIINIGDEGYEIPESVIFGG
jgi:hypothetical protein